MSDLRKAAEMALEALVNFGQGNSEPAKALRQALANPKWVGLTVDEVFECWKTGDVVAAVEAKLKEKNT